MLSMKAKYALRALMVMARNEKKMLASKSIAQTADIPQKFLDNILQELRQKGYVDSKRGIFGGYFLAKPAAEIMVGDLIRLLDGPLAPIRCASQSAYQPCEDCPDEESCQIRKTMVEVRNAIAGVLDHKSILDLAEQVTV
jgi:Rrf2 family protein